MAPTRTVFIPAAGRGSRLAVAGFDLPKPLLTTGGLPVVVHIIDLYPIDWTVVIALGHEGELVRESIERIYRDSPRLERILFCYTASYQDDGKGLTDTILDAQETLGGAPFVFHACDSFIRVSDSPWSEWVEPEDQVLVSQPESAGRYRWLRRNAGGAQEWTHEWVGSDDAAVEVYIGVSHVFDTSRFWSRMHQSASSSPEGGECLGLDPALVTQVALEPGGWVDTGSVDGFSRLGAPQYGEANILPKADECIWFTGSSVVKMHLDPDFIQGRVARADVLAPFVPALTSQGRNTYAYSYASGDTLSKAMHMTDFPMRVFLSFLLRFWFDAPLPATDALERRGERARYLDFYRSKTLGRTDSLTQRYPQLVGPTCINGRDTPALADQLEGVDWELLTSPLIGRVHGDLHPENILVTGTGSFLLLDWRQEIAGSRGAFGDVFYDLGKFAHGLRVDHGVVSRGEYRVIHPRPDAVEYSIARTRAKIEAYETLREFCEQQGFDWSRVRLIEALIYLNIAILHEPAEYAELLAYMGRDLLNSVSEPANR